MSQAPEPFASFVRAMTHLTDAASSEADILPGGRRLLGSLVADDNWLPEDFAWPDPAGYRQYLLYREPRARFSVVSFVWGQGQGTPIHDHTIWGLVGVLRGAELSQRFHVPDAGGPVALGRANRLATGAVEVVSPTVGDVHRVANAYDDRVSISIHVYGADIGAVQRWVYPPEGGRKAFVSGYDNTAANPPFSIELTESAA